jgi:Hemerythrin HHE cation binding domain
MDQMEAQHAQIDPLLVAIDDALGTRGSRERIRPLLTRLRGILADHLAHEEAEALPLISRVMTAAELGQIGKAIGRIGACARRR